jgi:hypothetical protein
MEDILKAHAIFNQFEFFILQKRAFREHTFCKNNSFAKNNYFINIPSSEKGKATVE